jgi:uncharacterized protein YkwD
MMRVLSRMTAAVLAALAGCSASAAAGPGPAGPADVVAAEPAPVVVAQAGGGGSDRSDRPASARVTLLSLHNRHRAAHCAPPLVWSAQLAGFAQAWANRLAGKGCRLEHRTRSPYGENLAAGTASIMRAEDAVNGWYREVRSYRFGRGGFSLGTGHFTQLVWLQSRRLGCGSARCGDIRLWVCNYDPPGNYEGQFRENVLRQGCRR